MRYNKKLNFWDYAAAVNAIADGFFDAEYNYIPHVGKINAMRIFYNFCVEDDIGGVPHNIEEIDDILKIVENDEFIADFNRALVCHGNDFDFGNAFKDALRIVETKKQSLGRAITIISESIEKIITAFKDAVPEGAMDKLAEISKAVESGKIDTNSLLQVLAQADKGETEKLGG